MKNASKSGAGEQSQDDISVAESQTQRPRPDVKRRAHSDTDSPRPMQRRASFGGAVVRPEAGTPGEVLDRVAAVHHHANPPTCSWYHAAANLALSVAGGGNLPYAWAISRIAQLFRTPMWLGAVLGAGYITFIAVIGWFTSMALASHDRSSDGQRYSRLYDAAEGVMGRWAAAAICSFPQQMTLLVVPVCFMISGGSSMQSLLFQLVLEDDLAPDDIRGQLGLPIVVIISMVLSMIKGYQNLWVLAAGSLVCILLYRSLVVVMDLLILSKLGVGTLTSCEGALEDDPVTLASDFFIALGSIAQCLNINAVQVEVQATLAEPPAVRASMNKAVLVSYAGAVSYALATGVLGYLALGSCAPQNSLATVLNPYSPWAWLANAVNMLSLVDILTSVQLFSQPIIDDLDAFMALCLSPLGFPESEYYLLRIINGPLLMLIYGVIASCAGEIATVSALIAGLGSIPLTFIMPGAIRIAATARRDGICASWLHVVLIVVGAVMSVLVTCAASYGIYKLIPPATDPFSHSATAQQDSLEALAPS